MLLEGKHCFTVARHEAHALHVKELENRLAGIQQALRRENLRTVRWSKDCADADPKFDLRREELTCTALLHEARALHNRSGVVKLATSTKLVGIGTILQIQKYDVQKNPIGKPVEVYVDGHFHMETEYGVPCAGYYSPLIVNLFGFSVAECNMVDVEIGTTRYLTLQKIRLPKSAETASLKAA